MTQTLRPLAPLPSFVALAALALPLAAQDVEQATHAADASQPQVAFALDRPAFRLRQYQLGCLSHLSYLVASGGEAVVIDPQRDVGHYLRDAEALGARIRFVALTHPHADFVAGHTELAELAGAEILIAERAHAGFAHRSLRDGDRVRIGGIELLMWETPGHTPDATTFLLEVPGQTGPLAAFTGDTLFVGSIGRPDLLDVPPAVLASQSFDSIQRLQGLPDATLVLPAHGAGSLCGAHLSPETVSTIGDEKRTNPFLQLKSRASFVANVLSHQPVAPQYFAYNVRLNREGPPRVDRDASLPPKLDAAAVRDLVARGGWVVDVRDQRDYAKGHVPGSINIALRGRLDTWMGIVVPVGTDLALVGDEGEIREGAFRLRRIGYDTVTGHLDGGIDAWRAAGGEVRQSKLFDSRALHAAMLDGTEPMLIDVRSRDEYEDLRLGDIGNLPVTESDRFATVLDPSAPVVMVCNSAYRSSMAVGLAERAGLVDVGSLDGGLDAWIEAGLPVRGRLAGGVAERTAATVAAGQSIVLPEPIDTALLVRVLAEQPGAYAVLDVRPAWQFAEWNVAGSENVQLPDLAARVAAIPAGRRIVLVDRDGTTAFAAAGALLALEPGRSIRVLLGGARQFHAETAFAGAHASAPPPAAGAVQAPAAIPAPATAPAVPQPPRKRSAGC